MDKVEDGLLVTDKQLRGQLACWVCRQHPFHSVEGVDEVGALIDAAAENEGWSGDSELRMKRFTDCREVEAWLRNAIWDHPQMAKWNTPRKDNGSDIAFVTRYSKPNPDYDFIDLSALVRNVALEAWRESEREHVFDLPVLARKAGDQS